MIKFLLVASLFFYIVIGLILFVGCCILMWRDANRYGLLDTLFILFACCIWPVFLVIEERQNLAEKKAAERCSGVNWKKEGF